MGKILLIMFIFGTLLVSACGSVQNDGNKVVQVEDKKPVASEIRIETLAKLQELKKQSEETYLHADKNAHIVELRGKEMAQFKSYRLQIEQEAEVQIATSKKQLEDEYQLKIFNLQMQLEGTRFYLYGKQNDGGARDCGSACARPLPSLRWTLRRKYYGRRFARLDEKAFGGFGYSFHFAYR